jgi:hypothetical protein
MGFRVGIVVAAALLAAALGCASGGGLAPDHCSIRLAAVEKWDTSRGLDVAYRVKGEAGSPGVVWVAARTTSGWISGAGVEVPAGPYEAVADLSLTGVPEELAVVLEVAGPRRCKVEGTKP